MSADLGGYANTLSMLIVQSWEAPSLRLGG